MTARDADRAAGTLRDVAPLAGGTIVRDDAGPAVYRLDPGAYATAVACARCRFVNVILSIPRAPTLVVECPQCRAAYRLLPPLAVLTAANRP